MRHLLGTIGAVTTTAAWLATGSPASAQQGGRTLATDTTAGLQEGAQQGRTPPEPVFRLFGIPFGVNAPVGSPYCACIYGNFAGQPMTGRNAVGAQTAGAGP
jgi:hypothetical protein